MQYGKTQMLLYENFCLSGGIHFFLDFGKSFSTLQLCENSFTELYGAYIGVLTPSGVRPTPRLLISIIFKITNLLKRKKWTSTNLGGTPTTTLITKLSPFQANAEAEVILDLDFSTQPQPHPPPLN